MEIPKKKTRKFTTENEVSRDARTVHRYYTNRILVDSWRGQVIHKRNITPSKLKYEDIRKNINGLGVPPRRSRTMCMVSLDLMQGD